MADDELIELRMTRGEARALHNAGCDHWDARRQFQTAPGRKPPGSRKDLDQIDGALTVLEQALGITDRP